MTHIINHINDKFKCETNQVIQKFKELMVTSFDTGQKQRICGPSFDELQINSNTAWATAIFGSEDLKIFVIDSSWFQFTIVNNDNIPIFLGLKKKSKYTEKEKKLLFYFFDNYNSIFNTLRNLITISKSRYGNYFNILTLLKYADCLPLVDEFILKGDTFKSDGDLLRKFKMIFELDINNRKSTGRFFYTAIFNNGFRRRPLSFKTFRGHFRIYFCEYLIFDIRPQNLVTTKMFVETIMNDNRTYNLIEYIYKNTPANKKIDEMLNMKIIEVM